MNVGAAVQELESLWSVDGFLFDLRYGSFDLARAGGLVSFLRRIDPLESDGIAAQDQVGVVRAISMLWYLAPFLSWQSERVGTELQGDYQRFKASVQNELERILGVP